MDITALPIVRQSQPGAQHNLKQVIMFIGSASPALTIHPYSRDQSQSGRSEKTRVVVLPIRGVAGRPRNPIIIVSSNFHSQKYRQFLPGWVAPYRMLCFRAWRYFMASWRSICYWHKLLNSWLGFVDNDYMRSIARTLAAINVAQSKNK